MSDSTSAYFFLKAAVTESIGTFSSDQPATGFTCDKPVLPAVEDDYREEGGRSSTPDPSDQVMLHLIGCDADKVGILCSRYYCVQFLYWRPYRSRTQYKGHP